MKTRLGLFVFMAVLAGCSAQDSETKSAQAVDSTLGTSAKAISGIAQYANDSKRSIGSAPDRGELFTYRPGATAIHEGAYTLRPVSLSEEHAIRAAVTGVMSVPGPDGNDIKIAYERHEEHPDGNWSWIGRVVGGDQAQEAIFTFGQEAVFGSIPQANGPSLKLTTQRGLAYLMQADANRLVQGRRAGNDFKVAAYRPNLGDIDSNGAILEMAMAKARATSSADVSTKAFTSANTIDLVAGYSNGLAARFGSDGAAVTRLNQLVTAGNQALFNSQISARIRLVGAVKVNYADNTDNGTALNQLTGHDGENPVTVPAALAPLRAARETTGADLVTLVRDFQPENNGCGIAWLLGANNQSIIPSSDSPFGYSIASDGSYTSGNTFFCEDISLIHELAHNMGSAHDIANAGTDTGRYPYSYGYKTTATAGNFFTVMAYGDDGQTLYRVFSSPNLTTCGGRVCGSATADNARSLSQTMPIISTFRNMVVPISAAPRNDINGDLKSDLIWRSTAGRISYWLMSGASISFSAPSVAQATSYSLVATGDFNGDGRNDLVWQSSANVVMWTAGAETRPLFKPTTVSATPAGWSIVGAADMDGDGKSDLLWRNTTTGNFSYWLMNGAAVRSMAASIAITPTYKLVAIGDFNGDGVGDLVWDNNVSVWTWTNKLNGTFTQTRTADHPAGWGILGSGDINGDGKSDLLWRNTASGNFSYWLMNGATATTKSASIVVPNSYKLAAVGDLSGDGKADLIWDNNVSVWAWLAPATGTTFNQVRVGNHPAGWTLQNPPGP